MGELVDLYEGKYLYQLGEIPNDEKLIIGHEQKKKDQYWRTPIFPDEFSWRRMTKREQFEIVDRERYRFENGVWFFNFGEPTYITGMHYDHLVNATFDFGKCQYYDSQRKDFYFREYIKADTRCFGQCTIKPRRYGYSIQEITQQTCESMADFSRKLGMISNNKDKTYETLFDPLVASYIMRPKWVRPDIYMPNNRIPKTELWWNSGTVSEKSGSYQYDSRGNLNSRLIPKPTTVTGYDGNKIHYLTLDEAWKWTLADPYECWKKQRPCLVVGTRIIGKGSVLSTMGDDDSYEEAIESGIKMFRDSDTTDRDENGHTKTGLYQYFVSGVNAMFDFSDPYGKIDVDRATTYILNDRKKYPEGSTDWTYAVRRYPLSKEEATSTATGLGIFNNQRLDKRIEILTKTIQPTKMGRLDEDPKGRVIWTPDNNALWEFDRLPIITQKVDYSNRWYKDQFDGQLYLMDNPQGCLGYDAIRYAEMDTTSKVLSNASIIGYQKFDHYGSGSAANTINCLWHCRPDDPEIGHYEAFKGAKFLGFPIAFERQMEAMKRRAIELNMLNFLLHSHYDGKVGYWTSKGSTKDGVDLIQGLWKAPNTMSEMDHMMRCNIIRVLQQAKVFNPAKTTIYDIIMSLVLAMLGSVRVKDSVVSDTYEADLNNILQIIQPKRGNKSWKSEEQEDQERWRNQR